MGGSVCSLVSKVATPFHVLTMSDTHLALAVIFDVPEGQEFKSFFPKFYAKVKTGTKDCIYYGFATCGNKVLCREGYKGAAGLMAHMGEVKEDLEKMIKQIGKERVKILMSGPASELDKVDEFKAGFSKFYAATKNGPGAAGCLYYGFGFAGDSMYCREGYKSAEDCAKHGADVKEMIEEPMKAVGAGNFKLNVVGPAAELEKLKPKLAPRGAIFWELDSGSMWL